MFRCVSHRLQLCPGSAQSEDQWPPSPPIIQLGPVNQTVTTGNILTLHCQFTARDKARVAWLKEGIPIEFSDNDRYYLTDGYNLQIKGGILLSTEMLSILTSSQILFYLLF